MDQQVVRDHAQAHCDALLAGNIDRALEDFSRELHSNIGALIGLMPLPLTEASIESVEPGGKGYVVVMQLVGEGSTVRLETRWKDRDGKPTIVEASHVVEQAPPAVPADEAGE
jgi:hypothetical protein